MKFKYAGHVARVWEKMNVWGGVMAGKPKERGCLEDLVLDGRIILKQSFDK
jgi:hypothetical protein